MIAQFEVLLQLRSSRSRWMVSFTTTKTFVRRGDIKLFVFFFSPSVVYIDIESILALGVQSILDQLHVTLDERLATRDVSRKLQFVVDDLKRRRSAQCSVLFVLDNFEQFARRERQTLLYALFDIAHGGLRAAVIGQSRHIVEWFFFLLLIYIYMYIFRLAMHA